MAKNQDSGENTRAYFASYDRALSSWRTPQLSLVAASTSYSGTWPRSGMMRNGRALERVTWERRTADGDASSSPGWPTPTSQDASASGSWAYRDTRPKSGRTLTDAVRQWPTPTATDSKGSAGQAAHQAEEGREGATLYPHPAFVEWLMGFPAGWVTDLCPELSKGQT